MRSDSRSRMPPSADPPTNSAREPIRAWRDRVDSSARVARRAGRHDGLSVGSRRRTARRARCPMSMWSRIVRVVPRSRRIPVIAVGAALLCVAALVPMTLDDFRVPGTQIGDVPPAYFQPSDNCSFCHGHFAPDTEIYSAWKGSLMALGGKDPLFFAQMTNANQDVGEVGYYCLRCHVPAAIVTGHAVPASGRLLDAVDRDGITCHFCHS